MKIVRPLIVVFALLTLLPVAALQLFLLGIDRLIGPLTIVGYVATAMMLVTLASRPFSAGRNQNAYFLSVGACSLGALLVVIAGFQVPAHVGDPAFGSQLVGAGAYVFFAMQIGGAIAAVLYSWVLEPAPQR